MTDIAPCVSRKRRCALEDGEAAVFARPIAAPASTRSLCRELVIGLARRPVSNGCVASHSNVRSLQGFPEGQMNFDKRSFGLALLWLAVLAAATVLLYAVVHH